MNIKSFIKGIGSQLRNLRSFLVLFYVPFLIFFLALAVLVKSLHNFGFSILFRDVTALGNLPFYAGFISQLGGLLWAAGITVSFFGYFFLRKLKIDLPQAQRFLLHTSFFLLVLLIDDYFLFHEEIAQEYLHISEKFVYLAYGILLVLYFYLNSKEILSSEYLILLLGFVFFGLSILFDVIPEQLYENSYLLNKLEIFVEDGFKFTGIATWVAFIIRYNFQIFSNLLGKIDTE